MLTNIGQSPDLPWLVIANLFCTIGCLDNCERNKEKQSALKPGILSAGSSLKNACPPAVKIKKR